MISHFISVYNSFEEIFMVTHIKNAISLDGEPLNIAIEDGIIVSVSKDALHGVADTVIDADGKLAIPGLINCHTHSYMSVFRNIADDVDFETWLFKSIMPLEDRLTNEDAYYGAMLSCIEMLKSGTVCFLDMHMFKGMTISAARDCGMRAVMSRGLVGSGDDEGGQRRIQETMDEKAEFESDGRFSFMLGPHAIYTCDEAYLRKVAALAKKEGMGIHIHVSETKNEFDSCVKEHGMTPVEYLDSLGIFDGKAIAAHCVYLTDNDIDILAKKGVYVAHNPKSNMKLGNGFAPIKKLLDAGAKVCLGTDSQGSNNCLNMFSEMNHMALIHKGTGTDPQAVSAKATFEAATRVGAEALGLNGGTLEVGKNGDVVLIDIERPQFYPTNNILSSLVYSANGSEVDTVIIGGKVVLENGKVVGIDEKEIYCKVNDIVNRLKKETQQ